MPKAATNKQLKKLGACIKKIRLTAKISRRQLAFEVGTSESYLRLLESGEVNPGVNTLYKLADALNLEITAFFID